MDAIPIGWLLANRAGRVRALHPEEGQAQPVGCRQDKLLGPGWGQHAASPRHGGAGLPPQFELRGILVKKVRCVAPGHKKYRIFVFLSVAHLRFLFKGLLAN
jgi:hypothetical protein